MKTTSIILGFTCLLASFAHAQDCTDVEVDIRPLSRTAPRDQGQNGLCYAFAAADLLSVELGEVVAPAHVASNFMSNWIGSWFSSDTASIQGGFASLAMEYSLSKDHLCAEKDLPYTPFNDFLIGSDYEELQQVYKDWMKDAPSPRARIGEKISTLPRKDTDAWRAYVSARPLLFSRLGTVFSSLGPVEIATLVRTSSARDIYTKLTDAHCARKGSVRVTHQPRIRRSAPLLQDLNFVDEGLNAGKMVQISIRAGLLEDANAKVGWFSNHAVSLVGRRFNKRKNRCEYQMRNSWGYRCDVYDSDFECSYGHVWLPATVLNQALDRAVYFE